jgi:hypothetical protein
MKNEFISKLISKNDYALCFSKAMVCLILLVTCEFVSAQAPKVANKGSMKKPFVLKQQIKHAAGISATFYEFNKGQEPVFGISYNPSISLTKSYSDFSFSVGSQLVGGYHISTSVDDSAYAYADLPLLAEFNFGHNASKDFYKDMGWFLGGGYAYRLFKNNWTSAPVASIGVRGFIFGPSFTIRYSRFFATSDNGPTTQTVSLLLNLGRYFDQVKLNNKVSRFSNGFRR